VHPQPESYWGNVNTVGPRSCDDDGKRVAETLMITRAQTLLGWTPTIELREGLERTVPYFADRLQRRVARNARRSDPEPGEFPFVERRRAYTEAAIWTERPAV
jgi:hypothetical protein